MMTVVIMAVAVMMMAYTAGTAFAFSTVKMLLQVLPVSVFMMADINVVMLGDMKTIAIAAMEMAFGTAGATGAAGSAAAAGSHHDSWI